MIALIIISVSKSPRLHLTTVYTIIMKRKSLTPKKRTYARRKPASERGGIVQISLSIPDDLLERIDSLAYRQNRTRSNFIATAMQQLAEELSI